MLGIRPWEWPLLTVEETDAVLDWLEAWIESREEAAEEMRRG